MHAQSERNLHPAPKDEQGWGRGEKWASVHHQPEGPEELLRLAEEDGEYLGDEVGGGLVLQLMKLHEVVVQHPLHNRYSKEKMSGGVAEIYLGQIVSAAVTN